MTRSLFKLGTGLYCSLQQLDHFTVLWAAQGFQSPCMIICSAFVPFHLTYRRINHSKSKQNIFGRSHVREGWVWVSDRRKILPNTKQPDTHRHPESGDLSLSLILSQHYLGLGFPRYPRDDWIRRSSAPSCFIP